MGHHATWGWDWSPGRKVLVTHSSRTASLPTIFILSTTHVNIVTGATPQLQTYMYVNLVSKLLDCGPVMKDLAWRLQCLWVLFSAIWRTLSRIWRPFDFCSVGRTSGWELRQFTAIVFVFLPLCCLKRYLLGEVDDEDEFDLDLGGSCKNWGSTYRGVPLAPAVTSENTELKALN